MAIDTFSYTVSLKEKLLKLFSQFFFKDVCIERSSLVLINPLSDPFGLSLASISERLGVSSVWQAKIQMMS